MPIFRSMEFELRNKRFFIFWPYMATYNVADIASNFWPYIAIYNAAHIA